MIQTDDALTASYARSQGLCVVPCDQLIDTTYGIGGIEDEKPTASCCHVAFKIKGDVRASGCNLPHKHACDGTDRRTVFHDDLTVEIVGRCAVVKDTLGVRRRRAITRKRTVVNEGLPRGALECNVPMGVCCASEGEGDTLNLYLRVIRNDTAFVRGDGCIMHIVGGGR